MKSSNTHSPFQKEVVLKRTIGVWGLSTHIVNIVVGVGIFVLPAIVILLFLSHLTWQEAFSIVIPVAVLTAVFLGMQWVRADVEIPPVKSHSL